jgi:hypothetical protein
MIAKPMHALCLLILSLFASSLLAQQSYQLNAYGGFVFDHRVNATLDANNFYRGTIRGGFQWGLGAEYKSSPSVGTEILYLRQDTEAPLTYFSGGVRTTNFGLALNYFMLASNRYLIKQGSRFEVYGAPMLGACTAYFRNPETNRERSLTRFAWGMKGGANVRVHPAAAIKLQAQLLSAVESIGGGLFIGTGGANIGLATYSSLYQFGFFAGIVITPGGKSSDF